MDLDRELGSHLVVLRNCSWLYSLVTVLPRGTWGTIYAAIDRARVYHMEGKHLILCLNLSWLKLIFLCLNFQNIPICKAYVRWALLMLISSKIPKICNQRTSINVSILLYSSHSMSLNEASLNDTSVFSASYVSFQLTNNQASFKLENSQIQRHTSCQSSFDGCRARLTQLLLSSSVFIILFMSSYVPYFMV